MNSFKHNTYRFFLAVGETLVVTSQRGGGSSIAECEFSALKKKRKRMRLGVETIYGQTVVLPGERPFELGSC